MPTRTEGFEAMLTGGHPNSLGRTIEVVDQTLGNPQRLTELFDCYKSSDPIVRLRVSNAMKRIARENRALLVPFIDRFLDEIGELQQDSAQWTLANLFQLLAKDMTASQKQKARAIMQRNLVHNKDWIVLNNTVVTLAEWATTDPELKAWLMPQLQRLAKDARKSVAGKAKKAHSMLAG